MLWRGEYCAHKVVIAMEIEIGSEGKAVGYGSIYHSGKPSEYYRMLFYQHHLLPTIEAFSQYRLSSDFVPSIIVCQQTI